MAHAPPSWRSDEVASLFEDGPGAAGRMCGRARVSESVRTGGRARSGRSARRGVLPSLIILATSLEPSYAGPIPGFAAKSAKSPPPPSMWTTVIWGGLLISTTSIRGAAGAYHDPALGGGTNLAHRSCSNATSNHPVNHPIESLGADAEEGEWTAGVLGGRAAAQGSWHVGSGHEFDNVHAWAEQYAQLFRQSVGAGGAGGATTVDKQDKAKQLLSMKSTGAGFSLDPAFKLPRQDFFDFINLKASTPHHTRCYTTTCARHGTPRGFEKSDPHTPTIFSSGMLLFVGRALIPTRPFSPVAYWVSTN